MHSSLINTDVFLQDKRLLTDALMHSQLLLQSANSWLYGDHLKMSHNKQSDGRLASEQKHSVISSPIGFFVWNRYKITVKYHLTKTTVTAVLI